MSNFQDKVTMTLAFDVKAAERLRRMDRWKAERFGLPAEEARRQVDAEVARAAGLAKLPLERARRGRLKGIRGFVAEAIEAAFVAALEKETRALEHELVVVRAGGDGVDDVAAEAARAAVASARRLIAEARK